MEGCRDKEVEGGDGRATDNKKSGGLEWIVCDDPVKILESKVSESVSQRVRNGY